MYNRLSMNVDQVAGHLIKHGIKYKSIHRTEEPEVEDDAINITDHISVQVSSYGDAYMSVGRWDPVAECFFYSPERLGIPELVNDIKLALKEES